MSLFSALCRYYSHTWTPGDQGADSAASTSLSLLRNAFALQVDTVEAPREHKTVTTDQGYLNHLRLA